ncbi:MAG TPA: aminopeptidase, partial [Ignisphaera sp.]|nr:aminopeptidase [Ignisphaera sp.]
MSITKLDFELAKAAHKLVKDILKISRNEEVVITADTLSDFNVVNAVARAVKIAGGKPLIAIYSTPIGVGKAIDSFIPLKSLSSLLSSADVWIELNKMWLLYSTPYEIALKENPRLRYICLVGIDSDSMARLIGRIDIELMYRFQRKLAEVTSRAKRFRIITPAGTDIVFENDPSRPVLVEGEISGPGEYMLFGQVDWAPIEEIINGTIVFDGSVWPPEELGLLREPIKLYIEKGKIVSIEGGREAKIFEKWLKSFNDPKMFY